MSAAPTIGLSVVARDEEENLPRLLGSVEGAFDQVVLLDTGSTDRTVEVFEEWANGEAERHPGFTWRVGRFDWCDDFAAARRAADDLLDTDWAAFADADESASGAQNLRSLVAASPPEVVGLNCAWNALGDGRTVSRCRVTKRGATVWAGRVHAVSVLVVPGTLALLPPSICRWDHHKDDAAWEESERRDALALRRWLAEEPDSLRAHQELANHALLDGVFG